MPVQFAGAHIIILPMIIYIFANASGAHFNPIITASFVASGRMVIVPSRSPCRAPCMLIAVLSSVKGQAQRSGHVSVRVSAKEPCTHVFQLRQRIKRNGIVPVIVDVIGGLPQGSA